MKKVLLSAQNAALILLFVILLVGECVTECLHCYLKIDQHEVGKKGA